MPKALQIDTDGTAEVISLPEDPSSWDRVLKTRLSGAPEPGHYHRQATMYVHHDGQGAGLQRNLLATAIACAWRGLDITYDAAYFLPGRVVVTAAEADKDLDPLLIEEAQAIAGALGKLLAPGPVAWGEVVAAATRALAGHRTG
ncbi:hypothetical protein [Kitasatospora griseola]|uniref:hypothetical protein n=1 Tax=Kitasatospora griseola TaxID=2064 RepID=UPI003421CB0B